MKCKNCQKVLNEIELMVGQCNDCDPFMDEEELAILENA